MAFYQLEVGGHNSTCRGYNPSYPFIKPFIGFIGVLSSKSIYNWARGPPCRDGTDGELAKAAWMKRNTPIPNLKRQQDIKHKNLRVFFSIFFSLTWLNTLKKVPLFCFFPRKLTAGTQKRLVGINVSPFPRSRIFRLKLLVFGKDISCLSNYMDPASPVDQAKPLVFSIIELKNSWSYTPEV